MGGQWRVVAAGPWDDPGWQHALEDAGCEVVLGRSFERFPGQAYTEGELIDLFKDADAVLVSTREQVTRRVLEACPHLKILAKRTIGIVGLGRVGSNVARRLTAWDVRLLAADPYIEPAAAHAVGAELVPVDDLLRESDVVTLHVVLTQETRHLIDETRLRAMKPTACLVNTSRGGVIDTAALVRAIQEDWIAAAALDVFEEEPLPLESPLRRLDPDRVILTPHCTGNSCDSPRSST